LERALAADKAVLEGVPEGVTVALHICRGNYRSAWLCEGSLEPVAEHVFALPYDAFLVEWDDLGRDGGFAPVRFLREDAVMVMGLVSTKSAQLEREEDLVRKLEEAAALAGGIDRVAISPQCGVRERHRRERDRRGLTVAEVGAGRTSGRPGLVRVNDHRAA